MEVIVTPSQFQQLQLCVIAFEMGLRGPHGWTVDDVKEQLHLWSMGGRGSYDRLRHDMGEPVNIVVKWD